MTCAWPRRAFRAGDVVGDGARQVVDVRHAVADIRLRQVDVLAADQIDVVGLARLNRAHHHRGERHETAGLAEGLVVLEQREDVLEGGMERVGGGDLVGDLFGGFRHGLGFHRVRNGLGEGGRHGVHDAGVGLGKQQTRAKDVIDLVGAEFDRRDALGLSRGLLLQIAVRLLDHRGDLLAWRRDSCQKDSR